MIHSAALLATLTWERFKDWLSDTAGLSHEAMHVLVGGPIFLIAAAVFRWPLYSWKPFAVVVLWEFANEALDFTRYAMAGWPWQHDRTIEQILLTLSVPTAIMLVAGVLQLWRGRHR